MERAAVAMAFPSAGGEKFAFSFFGLGERDFRGDRDVGVEFEMRNAGEHEFRELGGGELAFAEEFSDFLDGCEGYVAVLHRCHIKSQAMMLRLKPGATSPMLKKSFPGDGDSRNCRCSR